MDHQGLRDWERKALAVLARRGGLLQGTVEEQVRHCVVVSREHTGVGFYTRLRVEGDTALLPEGTTLDRVWGRLRGLEHEVGFVLFSTAGLVSLLEGFANVDDKWPADDPELTECWIVP